MDFETNVSRYEVEDFDEFQVLARSRRWDDGLPVIPPTPERVGRMLGELAGSADQVVAVLPPRFAEATVAKIAINTVMAGCDDGVLPILVAAVRTIAEPQFRLSNIQATTHSCGLMLLVGGPAASTAQQATRAPPFRSSSGRSIAQRLNAYRHRGWKAQPGGGLIGDGNSPSSRTRALRRAGSATGVAASSARV